MAEEGLARFPRHIASQEWLSGFNPYAIFSMWRGMGLIWMGRLPEGIEEFSRTRRIGEEDGTPQISAHAMRNAAEAHCHAHDADGALACARQIEEISRRQGEPAAMVALMQLAFGYAHLAAGRASEAIERARDALDLWRLVDKSQEATAATLLAEALLQAGDLPAAESAAVEAIEICGSTLRGNFEAEAHGVLARALLRRDGAVARDAAEAALTHAAELIERTGAKTLAPALCEWRAELAAVLGDDATREQLLRQAAQLYEEIGAPLHAARLAAERQKRSA